MTLATTLNSKTLLDNKDLLGGKGASLKQMTNLGLPVPSGFILTTETWRIYNSKGKLTNVIKEKISKHLKQLEKTTGKKFGSLDNPLLLSVRSGAKYSMPGMMNTILNVGITENNLPGLTNIFGDEKTALDCYRRFIRAYASSVYNVHDGDFDLQDTNDLKETISNYKGAGVKFTG